MSIQTHYRSFTKSDRFMVGVIIGILLITLICLTIEIIFFPDTEKEQELLIDALRQNNDILRDKINIQNEFIDMMREEKDAR